MNSIELDSLGRAELLILFKTANPLADSLFVNKLKSLGVNIIHLWGPDKGRIGIFGFMPIYKLEEIAKDTSVIEIRPPYATSLNMGAHDMQ